MQELRRFCANQSKCLILLDALGFSSLAGVNDRIAPLLEHVVVVGIDTEAWTRNTDEMTEIGLAVFEKKDMIEVQARKVMWEKEHGSNKDGYEHLGAFGEHLLKEMTFQHLRIVETAHLKSNAGWMKGAEGNRFGFSRFVTFAEARTILDSLFSQPVASTNPSLEGCKKPVVLVGHAVYHDEENLRKNGLAYDWFKHGTIVTDIDTQPLAKITHTWASPEAPNNEVGLNKLTKRLGFEHQDAHTACNDAARTVISAIQMVLPKACKEGQVKDMQTVALETEQHSRDTFSSGWGSELCCTRCGGRDHQYQRCDIPVHCKACAQFDKGSENEHWKTHIDQYCLHVAEYKAWVRRRDDAKRKGNPIPPGPPESTHPTFDPTVALYTRDMDLPKVPVPQSASSLDILGSPTSSNVVSYSVGRGPDPVTRIVSYQSTGRGRGRGRGHSSQLVAGTSGGNVSSRDWRRGNNHRS